MTKHRQIRGQQLRGTRGVSMRRRKRRAQRGGGCRSLGRAGLPAVPGGCGELAGR